MKYSVPKISPLKLSRFLDIDLQYATLLLQVLRGEISTYAFKIPKHVEKYSNQERKLFIANKLIGGYGVEAAQYGTNNYLLYVNTGDTYNATLLCDQKKGRYIFSTLGDVVESMERRGARFV